MSNSQESPALFYIMGGGRSGSTVLAMALGTHPDIESVGEIKSWARHEGKPRDLNASPIKKKFWNKVFDAYVENTGGNPDFKSLEKLCDLFDDNKKGFLNTIKLRKSSKYKEYRVHCHALLNSIYRASGKKCILDSSKSLPRAYNLLKNYHSGVKVIHLIRDPRGVMYSSLKQNVEQKAKGPLKSLFDYIVLNVGSSILSLMFKKKVLKIRYEDFVLNPHKIFLEILIFLDLEPGKFLLHDPFKCGVDAGNLIDGNRVRKDGVVKIVEDNKWKSSLPLRYKFLAMMLGLPVYNL